MGTVVVKRNKQWVKRQRTWFMSSGIKFATIPGSSFRGINGFSVVE